MLKRFLSLSVFSVVFLYTSVNANPVIINDLGGLYLNKNVTEIEMKQVNKVIEDYTIKEAPKNETINTKNKEDDAVNMSTSSEYTFKKGTIDVSQDENEGIEIKGVNNSKTIYTDDLGRLHFFGKGSIVRE